MSKSGCGPISIKERMDLVSCDGCDALIRPGEMCIEGIDSCCGACTRTLCRKCVETAAALMAANDEEEPS